MPWATLLERRAQSSYAYNGRAPPNLSDAGEKSTGHESPPEKMLSPSDPDRRFSFVSPTPTTSTPTKIDSSPKVISEEALLALTAEPLSHGGAWSSPPSNPNPKPRNRFIERIYTGIGEHHQKTASELARETLWMKKRKTTLQDKKWEAQEAEMDKVRSRERWTRFTDEREW
ncbi:hypothetical protein SBOR_3069 [Sclerotinia borealis F-4128]|uniref:Uncharacterized protein n=1 Tax=Sclerotinia borealis (strain F-4128) TaxID=1432307 RepID=W9CIH7_SCLBF|nr:hypothetical protein SBOR_3069 [Sclerotinia borealis F-4128]